MSRERPAAWKHRDVDLVLPQQTVEGMFRRAEQWDIEKGGRFDKRGAAVLIWSTNASASEEGEPTGAFYVKWHTPIELQSTIYRLEWDQETGGTEAEVWNAIDVLHGSPVTRP